MGEMAATPAAHVGHANRRLDCIATDQAGRVQVRDVLDVIPPTAHRGPFRGQWILLGSGAPEIQNKYSGPQILAISEVRDLKRTNLSGDKHDSVTIS
jgi:hypothetical protein